MELEISPTKTKIYPHLNIGAEVFDEEIKPVIKRKRAEWKSEERRREEVVVYS